MTDQALGKKNLYARSVCLFLAEHLRSRRITLVRASDIAQKVLANINLIDTERDFLKLVKQMKEDFEELGLLEDQVHQSIYFHDRKEMELQVRDFVSMILPFDTAESLKILQEAIRDDIKLPDLENEFPDFKKFIKTQNG